MKSQEIKDLKDEFYKKFCKPIEYPWVKDGDGQLYLFKDMGTRPSHIWEWIEGQLNVDNEKRRPSKDDNCHDGTCACQAFQS